MPHFSRILHLVATSVLLFATAEARAQRSIPKAPDEDRGLIIPTDVEPKPAGDRRVVMNDIRGEAVVAKVVRDLTSRYLTLTPDGRMMTVPVEEATFTERPFTPLTPAQLAEKLTGGPFPGFKTRTTEHFVYVYDSSDTFCTLTRTILETMYPKLRGWCEKAGLEVHNPEAPMVVVMFRDGRQFQDYWGGPEGMVAFYNYVTNYTIMYEPDPRSATRPQMYNLIAHEGVHQILANLGVQQRLSRWPPWFTEGLADYCSPVDAARRVRWSGVGERNEYRYRELANLVRTRGPASIADGALVREAVSATAPDAGLYAKSWGLVHYLASRREREFNAYLAEAAQLEPLTTVADGTARFEKHFGDDLPGIQAEMLEHLRTLR
jgi:hypothetical protein